MKRFVSVLTGLIILAMAYLEAGSQGVARTWILQNLATAASTGTVAHVAGFTVATVQIIVPAGNSPAATVVFQQSMNDIHYASTRCIPTDGSSAHTSVTFTPANVGTQPLLWRCNISGAYWFRTQVQYFSGPGSVSVFGIMTAGDPQVSSTGGFLIDATSFPLPVVQSPQQGAWPVIAHLNASTFPIPVNAHVQSVSNVYAGASPISVLAHQATNWTLTHISSVTHVALYLNSHVGTGQQAVTATAAQLPNIPARRVCLKVVSTGTQSVFIGTVSVAINSGIELVPGESYCTDVSNVSMFYVIANATGSTISWLIEK